MPTIVHFEIPADDIERGKKFYRNLFGWKIEKWSGQSNRKDMEYWIITTTDDKGNKELGGRIFLKVQQLGGKVHISKTAVPGMGYFAICLEYREQCFWNLGE